MVWLGLLLGFLSGFLVLYSLQIKRPYPDVMLNVLDEPWIIAFMIIVTMVVYMWDERVAIVLGVIIMFFLLDLIFLGRK